MKYTVILPFFLGVFILFFLTGCSGGTETNTTPETESVTLSLSGSGGGTTILKAVVEPFQAEQTAVTLDFLSGSGGSASKQAVADGQLDIGILLSSDIAGEPIPGIEVLPLGLDPLAFVVHPDLAVRNLTSTQLQDIYMGRITNWNEVGGPDAPIAVLTRNADEASTIILRQELFGDDPFTAAAVVLDKAGKMRDAVTSTPHSIGFMSYGDFVIRELAALVVTVDNIHPRQYHEGNYPFTARTMAIVYAPDNQEKVQSFLDYLQRETTQTLIETKGLAPIE